MPRAKQIIVLIFAITLTAAAQSNDEPSANPARPTVSTPATLTPVGYLQFETGYLYANHSPEFDQQSSMNEVTKLTIFPRLQFLVSAGPFAHSELGGLTNNAAGGVSLGAQAVLYKGEGAKPTIAASYFRSVYDGDTPDLDIGSAKNSASILASADVKGFHYDTNFIFNEQESGSTSRAQFGQTLSISHPLVGKFGIAGEIWRFTQPFLRSNAVGNLWTITYNAKKNLVLDAGFNRGLTDTSTRWEVFVGFTYLLPHRVLPRW